MKRSLSVATLALLLGTATALAQVQDPRDVPGCTLWLDAADPDGDFQPGGNFENGTRWIDKSPQANAHADQTAANRQPEVTPDALNGLATIRFDGNDFMDIDSAAFGMLNGVSGCTLFGLASPATRPNQGGQRVLMISSGTNSAGSRAGLNIFDSFGTSLGGSGDLGLAGRRLDSDSFQRIEGGQATLNEFVQWTGIFDYANQTLKLYVDGTLETEINNFQTPGSTSPTDSLNIRIGADAALNSVRGLFTGDIAELAAYNRVLSDTERQDIENYLQEKWFPTPPPPTLIATGTTTTSVQLQATGPAAATYILAASPDLNDWNSDRQQITIPTSGTLDITIPLTEAKRFYRLETIPVSPQ